jgi:long-chain fatty acid transport protein
MFPKRERSPFLLMNAIQTIQSLFIILLTVILFFSPSSSGGYSHLAVGGKALSLGGAFRGCADDWSAAYWNPAGLDRIYRSTIAYSMTSVTSHLSAYPAGDLPGFDNRIQVECPRMPAILPSISCFRRVDIRKRKLTAGIAIFTPYHHRAEWDLYDIPFYYGGGEEGYPPMDHSVAFSITDIHPAVAMEIYPNLSVGVGLSIYYGRITWQHLKLTDTGDSPFPVSRIPVDEVIRWRGFSIGTNAGIMYRPARWLQIGCAAKTARKMFLSGSVERTMYIPEAFTEEFGGDRLRTSVLSGSMRLPIVEGGGIGIALYPCCGFLIACDLAFERWRTMDDIDFRFSGVDPDGKRARDERIPLDWNDTWVYSLGMSYQLFHSFHVHTGYSYDRSAVPDETYSLFLGEIGDRNSFHAGCSFMAGGMTVRFAYQFNKMDNRYILQSTDLNADGIPDRIGGEYSGKTHWYMLGVTIVP